MCSTTMFNKINLNLNLVSNEIFIHFITPLKESLHSTF